MVKNILITNDDGILADGLIRLAAAAVDFGNVWVAAPDAQRSAASHSITLHSHIDVFPVDFPVKGVKGYKSSGTPADCVRVGVLNILPEKPDIVLSGINNGYNVASDIQYSATAGAAFEASFQGCMGIAFSEKDVSTHEVSDAYISKILAELIDREIPSGTIWNVNFPGCPLAECKGVLWNRKVSDKMVFRDTYDEIEALPHNGVRFKVHAHNNKDAENDTDLKAVFENYVSVGLVKNVG